MQDSIKRRRFAQITAIGLLGAAGCTGSEDDGDSANADVSDDDSDGSDAESGGNEDQSSDDAEETEEAQEEEEDTPDVTILEHELVKTELDDAHVEGKVENTSGEEQSYIGLEAKFFNADDERIGDGMTNATDVDADTVVNFEIISTVDYEEVDSYELEASTSPL